MIYYIFSIYNIISILSIDYIILRVLHIYISLNSNRLEFYPFSRNVTPRPPPVGLADYTAGGAMALAEVREEAAAPHYRNSGTCGERNGVKNNQEVTIKNKNYS